MCTYCGVRPGRTRDHVPPKGLFARPRPNLITVPCCEECRRVQSLDDEYFVQTLSMKSGLLETPSSRDARNAAMRALSKPAKRRFTRAFLRSVQDVALHSPGGIYLGNRLAYDVDLDRLCRVITRIVQGLHFEEFKTMLPEDDLCKAYALDGFAESAGEATRNVKTLWELAVSGRRRDLGKDVFTYWVREVQDSSRVTIWAFIVYGGVSFLAITFPISQPAATSSRPRPLQNRLQFRCTENRCPSHLVES